MWHFNDKYRGTVWQCNHKFDGGQKYTTPHLDEKTIKNGIPTVPSDTPSTKMLVQEVLRVLREVDNTLMAILTQMQALAKSLPEYPVVRAMRGVGNVLTPKLIAEIGDVRRFYSGKALIAHARINAPPYQSGQFVETEEENIQAWLIEPAQNRI